MKQPKEKVLHPNKLGLYRKRCGYSLKDTATILAVPANTLSEWEKGVIAPDIAFYFSLGHRCKVEPLKLYGPYVKQLEAVLNKRVKELFGNRRRLLNKKRLPIDDL